MEIESKKNPGIKEVIRLRERRERDRTGYFLIEGFRELSRAVLKAKCLKLYICKELFLGSHEDVLIEGLRVSGCQVLSCTPAVFRHISYRDRPDGLLAVAEKMGETLSNLSWEGSALFVLAESIEKPGNLGTILRSADAVGATGLIVADRCTDLYNPNVVRASTGTLFTVPSVEASGDEALFWLKDRGVQIVATSPAAPASYTEVDFKGPVAIAMGCEQLGLSQKLMKAASIQVSIPMRGVADSLNVAMATTLLLYEALRQRM